MCRCVTRVTTGKIVRERIRAIPPAGGTTEVCTNDDLAAEASTLLGVLAQANCCHRTSSPANFIHRGAASNETVNYPISTAYRMLPVPLAEPRFTDRLYRALLLPFFPGNLRIPMRRVPTLLEFASLTHLRCNEAPK